MSSKMVAKRPRRSIYILPNLFTTAALMCAFAAILMALDGHFERSCFIIFLAMILDGLDGRVARWTNTQSEFGEQYDSLADMVSFGLAPALIIYLWAFKDHNALQQASVVARLGWFVAFIYTACAALRLARFNVSIGSIDKRFFMGLPSPAAAAIVIGFVWVCIRRDIEGPDVYWLALLLTLYAGLMMVSNTLFYSFKSMHTGKKVNFFAMIVVVVFAGFLFLDLAKTLFITALLYGMSGPIFWFVRRKRRAKPIF